MKITLKSLEENEACEGGLDWFKENFGVEADSEQIIKKLKKLKKIKCAEDWMGWLFGTYKLSGICEGWYEDGNLKYRHNRKNGRVHGLCEGWYENGKLKYRHNWKDGKLHGLSEAWHENGNLKYRHNYKDGVYMVFI